MMTQGQVEGVRIWRNKKGWKCFEIHYTADPDKRTPEWKARALSSMPDLQSFNREFEIDWTSTSGLPFYPVMYKKYIEERSYFIRAQEIPPPGVRICRGFDFGFHRPACVFAWQDKDGTLRVLREFLPREIDVYSFRDAVRFISGEISQIEDKHVRARAWCERLAPNGPWFPKGTAFVNYCGLEAKKIQSITGDFGEVNDFEVFEGGNIGLSIVNQRVSAGTYILRQLQKDSGGSPRLLIDPSCTTLIAAMCGGLTFGEGTKATPLDDEVAVHPEYSHVHDALRYLVTGIINVADVAVKVNLGLAAMERERPKPAVKNPEPPRYGPADVNKWEDAPFYASPEDDD
jgi:hypothetical protein